MPKNKNIYSGPIVLIRGAGELASGVAWALAKVGFRVALTEVAQPLMVRWPVCFGNAVAERIWQVEGFSAKCVDIPRHFNSTWEEGLIPVLVDPDLVGLTEINPVVVVDAIMAKRNLGTYKDMAPLTIALGPGFTAGVDVHVVIETNRGHNLGRLIYAGPAEPNTGVPGEIGGATRERVLYSPISGIFHARRQIGERIQRGDVLGEITDGSKKEDVRSTLDGVLRGLLKEGTPIGANVKIGDIDHRGKEEYCWTISEKARLVGSSVLLAILEWQYYNRG